MVVVFYLWVYFVCNSTRRELKAKAWKRICRRELLLRRLSIRLFELFVFTPQITPSGMIIEVKSTFQLLQEYLYVNAKNRSCG